MPSGKPRGPRSRSRLPSYASAGSRNSRVRLGPRVGVQQLTDGIAHVTVDVGLNHQLSPDGPQRHLGLICIVGHVSSVRVIRVQQRAVHGDPSRL